MAGQKDPVVMPHHIVTGNPDPAMVIPMVTVVLFMMLMNDDHRAGVRRGGSEGGEAEQAAEQNCEMMFHIGSFVLGVAFGREDRQRIRGQFASTSAEAGAGSIHLPCSRMRSWRRSTASASGMLNFTGVLPT